MKNVDWTLRDHPDGAKRQAFITDVVKRNLGLVHAIARKVPDYLPLVDKVQEGVMGLMTAVEKFDPELGYTFSTYATWWIRQAIQRACADKGLMIRIPAWQWTFRSGKADHAGGPPATHQGLEGWMAPAHEREYERLETEALSRQLSRKLMARLTASERHVVIRYFGLDGSGGVTYATIARERGFSRERARQIMRRALTKMRMPVEKGKK